MVNKELNDLHFIRVIFSDERFRASIFKSNEIRIIFEWNR